MIRYRVTRRVYTTFASVIPWIPDASRAVQWEVHYRSEPTDAGIWWWSYCGSWPTHAGALTAACQLAKRDQHMREVLKNTPYVGSYAKDNPQA